MSSQTTYEPSRNSSRRGGRNRGRRGGSGNRSNGGGYRSSQSRPEKKKTLWEKIVAFFTGGESSKPATRPASPARSENKPVREASAPREERAERTERKSRKPEQVEVTSSRIYVGNLSFDASESDLFELFAGVGLVQNVEVVSNRQTQRSKGFAFVQMQTVEEAKRAVEQLHDKEYMGRKLVVSGAKALDERRASERAEAQVQQPEQ